MKLYQQEVLRDDLYKAIEKVLQDHYDKSTFDSHMIPPSHIELVTNSAMQTILCMDVYYTELKDDGYIK